MLTLSAPAKINLTLEVLGQRADGYHQLASVVQSISLEDTLSFQPNKEIHLVCNLPELISSDNLVIRAARLLQEVSGCRKGATIFLNKGIPPAAGLGGGSSDAAATLNGLNQLWELGFHLEKLRELASKLGSDVPFFLYGGTALVEGRGNEITPLPSPTPFWLVLAKSPLNILNKTEKMYASLNPSHFTGGNFTQKVVDALHRGDKITSSLCYNVFEQIAFLRPELEQYRRCFIAAGAGSVHLAGAGPTLFTLIEKEAQGEKLLWNMKCCGMEAYLARTL